MIKTIDLSTNTDYIWKINRLGADLVIWIKNYVENLNVKFVSEEKIYYLKNRSGLYFFKKMKYKDIIL